MTATGAALATFREAMLHPDIARGGVGANFDAWDQWESRRSRYTFNWGMYNNNLFQDFLFPGLSAPYKSRFGLYRETRHLYNPANRLVDFYATYTHGGSLDPEAGGGDETRSALPIETDNQSLRPAIARAWDDSRWQVNKDHYIRIGAALGDVALKVVDDTQKRKVYLQVVYPGSIKWADRDPYGRVRSYIIEEYRRDPRVVGMRDVSPNVDPRSGRAVVRYTEKAFLDGEDVVYQTFLNGLPFDWNISERDGLVMGNRAGAVVEWSEPYGFVPLVIVEHESVGLGWGLCCFHAGLSRFREVDDAASNLGDQIRKAINGPWLVSGVKAPGRGQNAPSPNDTLQFVSPTPTPGNPMPDRQSLKYITAPADAKATPMVFPLDIAGVTKHIEMLKADIEQCYSELLADVHAASGAASGRALRVARQRASARVQARRPGYDDGLVCGLKMLLAMSGLRGYDPVFRGFGPGELESDAMKFRVSHRPVFDVDPMDELEEIQSFWSAAVEAAKAGCPLEMFLTKHGDWTKDEIKELMAARAEEAAAAVPIGVAATTTMLKAQEAGTLDAAGVNAGGVTATAAGTPAKGATPTPAPAPPKPAAPQGPPK
jgi:hypothetical protein